MSSPSTPQTQTPRRPFVLVPAHRDLGARRTIDGLLQTSLDTWKLEKQAKRHPTAK